MHYIYIYITGRLYYDIMVLFQERYITSLADLVALTCLVSVSPKVREAAAQHAHSRADVNGQ